MSQANHWRQLKIQMSNEARAKREPLLAKIVLDAANQSAEP
jgi:hypothetical protein